MLRGLARGQRGAAPGPGFGKRLLGQYSKGWQACQAYERYDGLVSSLGRYRIDAFIFAQGLSAMIYCYGLFAPEPGWWELADRRA